MEKKHFIQSHPLHVFSSDDRDYSFRDKYYIQSLKAMEGVMDIDAFIIDYQNKRILYATKGCEIYFGKKICENNPLGFYSLDHLLLPEDLLRISIIHTKLYDFFYSLSKKKRLNCYYTEDFRIKTIHNTFILINHKVTTLDITDNGTLRLTLNIISYPTSDRSGNSYIKMTDTNTIYEYIPTAGTFVRVKTQKLTSKAATILKLASNGKTELQIAKELSISINTVKYHKKRIFTQLGVRNTAEAIQWMNSQKKMIEQL